MRVTVLGCCGAWPTAGAAGSGYLVEQAGFRLLLDAGYAVVPRLQEYVAVGELDAVLISHGHPDHCVDLNPLLRARVLREDRLPPLPVFAPAGALHAVLALDRPGLLNDGYTMHEIEDDTRFTVGPFDVQARLLPHSVPNAGVRLEADGRALAYTGDSGPSSAMLALARDADLLLAEASFVDRVPHGSRVELSSAQQRGDLASDAGVQHLLLTHLLPGVDPTASAAAARQRFRGEVTVARAGLAVDVGTDGG